MSVMSNMHLTIMELSENGKTPEEISEIVKLDAEYIAEVLKQNGNQGSMLYEIDHEGTTANFLGE